MFHEKGNTAGINEQPCDTMRACPWGFPHHSLQPNPLAVVLQKCHHPSVVMQRKSFGNIRDIIQWLENIAAAGTGSMM